MAGFRHSRKKQSAPGAAEPTGPRTSDELRRQAEDHFDGLSAAATAAAAAVPVPEEISALLHELRVHQIELEMQNEELRRAHLELDEQREKYFELFDLAPVGYLTLSDMSIVGDANLTAAHLLGVERQRLMGRPFGAFVFAADREVYDRHLKLLRQTGWPQSCELRLRSSSAQPFWVRLEWRLQDAVNGAPPRIQLIFSDVHEKVVAEQALRESEGRYRSLFADAVVVMLLIDPRSGAIVEVNPAACAWYGWSREEMLAMRIEQLNTLSQSEVRAEMESARTRQRTAFRFKHRRADGTIRDVEVFSGPLELQGKTLLYSMVHDVTEHMEAEQALQESDALHRAVLETTMDGFWLVDMEGRLLEVNEAYCRLSGYSAEELLTMAIGDLETVETVAETAARIAQVKARGEDRFEARHRRKDGTLFDVEVSVQYLPGRDARFMVFLRDVTARKQAESYREMGREVLQILNEPGDLRASLRRVLGVLKSKSGIDAVGIRLQDGEDFPYFAQEGFAEGFLLTENTLLERNAAGAVMRDKEGRVRLECTCGLVISGKTGPAGPLFTAGGSFWTNDSFPLLDLPSDEDPRHRPRNRCMHEGYASMALVPIRSGDTIVGLIHLDDRQKGRFTLEEIESLEDIATHIGAALLRKQVEHRLEERAKELQGLYGLAEIAEKEGLSLDAVYQELTDILPRSWQYPEIAGARTVIGEHEFRTHDFAESAWMQSAPVKVREAGVGRIEVGYREEMPQADEGPFLKEERQLLEALAERLGRIIERKRAEEELGRLNEELVAEAAVLAAANATITRVAATDTLTGLANRRHFYGSLEKAISLARRHGSPLALVSLDLDGLKRVNDTSGHEAGDEVLRSFAGLLASLCRSEDLPARLGGDEFSVLLPGVDTGGARGLAERVLTAVRSSEALVRCDVTVSAGVAAWTLDESYDDLLRRADEALYAAKGGGGDAVAAA